MSSLTPTFSDSVSLPAALLLSLPSSAAVDVGSSLTKLLFVPRDAEENAGRLPLLCLSFPTSQLSSALCLLRCRARLSRSLPVTGFNADIHRACIEQVLGLEVVIVPESDAIARGLTLLLHHADPHLLFHPEPEFPKWDIDRSFLRSWLCPTEQPSSPAVAALVFKAGGRGAMMGVDESGRCVFSFPSVIAGDFLMRLASVMVKTEDYEALNKTAEMGTITNVDYTIEDLFGSAELGDYGDYPAQLPSFPMGKVADASADTEYLRADLAKGLLSVFATDMAMQITREMSRQGCERLFVVGNAVRGKVMRQLVHERVGMYSGREVKCFKGDVVSGVGALFSQQERH